MREHSTIRGAISEYVLFDKLDEMSDQNKKESNKPDNPLPYQSIRKSREPVAASDHAEENLPQFLLKKRPSDVTIRLIQRQTRLLPNLESDLHKHSQKIKHFCS